MTLAINQLSRGSWWSHFTTNLVLVGILLSNVFKKNPTENRLCASGFWLLDVCSSCTWALGMPLLLPGPLQTDLRQMQKRRVWFLQSQELSGPGRSWTVPWERQGVRANTADPHKQKPSLFPRFPQRARHSDTHREEDNLVRNQLTGMQPDSQMQTWTHGPSSSRPHLIIYHLENITQ